MLQLILWNGQKIWTKKIWIYKKFEKKKFEKNFFFLVRTYVKPNVVFSKIPFTPGGGGGYFTSDQKWTPKKFQFWGGSFTSDQKWTPKKFQFWEGGSQFPKMKNTSYLYKILTANDTDVHRTPII